MSERESTSSPEFTGERLVPGKADPLLELEHVSRYRYAARVVGDRVVADFGCGAGYGSAILREAGARAVHGFDRAFEAVLFGRDHHAAPSATFFAGDCERTALRDASVDVAIAFEVVEHLRSPASLIAEARRVLRPDGVFLVSTPNRPLYQEARGGRPNVFHVTEFDLPEFTALLEAVFPHVEVLGQALSEGMVFHRDGQWNGAFGQLQGAGRAPDRWSVEDSDFLLGVCWLESERVETASSFLAWSTENTLRDRDRTVRSLQEELEDRTRWARSLEAESERRGSRVVELQGELEERTRWAADLESEAERKEERLAALQQEFEDRTRWAKELESEAEDRGRQLTELRQEFEDRTRWALELDVERQRALDELSRLEGRLADLQELATETSELRRRLDELRGETADGLRRERQARLELEQRLEKAAEAAEQRAQRTLQAAEQLAEPRLRALEKAASEQGDLVRWQGSSLVEQRSLLTDLGGELSAAQSELAALGAELEVRADEGAAATERVAVRLESVAGVLAATAVELSAAGEHHRKVERSFAEVKSRVEMLWGSRPWRSYVALGRLLRGQSLGPSPAEKRRAAALVQQATEWRRRSVAAGISFHRQRQPPVSVVIPSDGDLAEVFDCLVGLVRALEPVRFEVLIAHHGPPEPARSAWKDLSGVRVVTRGGEAGEVVNEAVRRARGRWVVLLDPRVRAADGWLTGLVETAGRMGGNALIAPRLLDPEGEIAACGGVMSAAGPSYRGLGAPADSSRFRYLRSIDFCAQGCVLVDRRLLLRLGGLDGRYGVGQNALLDLSFRAAAAGHPSLVQPAVSLVRLPSVGGGREDDADDAPDWVGRWQAGPRRRERRRVLLIDHRMPTPDQDSGSVRMDALLDILGDCGWQVVFLPINLGRPEPYCSHLEGKGVEVATAPEFETVEEFLEARGGEFELVVVSRLHVARECMDLVRTLCPAAKVVFDTVDLQGLRKTRRAELEGDPELFEQAEKVRAAELKAARQADATLVVSSFEQTLLREEDERLTVSLVSNIHTVREVAVPFGKRRDLFFVGGFEHPPNIDAVCWLVGEIFPRVRRLLSGVRLYLVGSKPTPEVLALGAEDVIVTGYQEDMSPYLDGCRLSVAPLRYGAGVKGKVGQSLAHGVPCVLTNIAAEGMGLTHGVDTMIADDADEFARCVARVYGSRRLWRRISRAGMRRIAEGFSPEVARRGVVELLELLELEGAEGSAGA